MTTAVLIHGAWQGAWCWERVTPLLESAGHRVIAPTLTGSGARASQLSPSIDLGVHVADVVEVIHRIDEPVALAAHSYAGMLLPGVADAVGHQLASVVYVDAFHPDHTESALDLMPSSFQERFRQLAEEEGSGWKLPASEALLDVWGVDDDDDRAWIQERLSDWSLHCFESACEAPQGRIAHIPRWYVAAGKDCPSRAVFAAMADRARAAGCTVLEAPTGHDVMIQAPDSLASVILDALRVDPVLAGNDRPPRPRAADDAIRRAKRSTP